MKQLLVLSGKGGTGKTTVASSLIYLSRCKTYADCDVDAPNLHLICDVEGTKESYPFYGLLKAVIEESKCIGCNKCIAKCHFDAISLNREINKPIVSLIACEGCGLCEVVCPTHAVHLKQRTSGEVITQRGEKFFASATLKMGAGASGKLVSQVKARLRESPYEGLTIIDGSPGIGCPVIASISGAEGVLIVTEPTVSGLNDLKRIVTTSRQFKVPVWICINKYDMSIENTRQIEAYCKEQELQIIGKLPFDEQASSAINQGKSVVEQECLLGESIRKMYKHLLDIIKNREMDENEDSSSK